MSSLKEKFEALRPETRQRIFVSGFVGLAVMVTLGLYLSNRIQTANNAGSAQTTTKVGLDNKLAENTTMTLVEGLKKDNAALRKDLDDLKKGQPGAQTVPGATGQTPAPGQTTPPPSPANTSAQQLQQIINNKQSKPSAAPAPALSGTGRKTERELTPIPRPEHEHGEHIAYKGPPPPLKTGDSHYTQGEVKKIGGFLEAPPDPVKKTESDAKPADNSKKKEKNTVHLPVSFMAATTLNGLAVPATENGKGDPAPMIIRVSTPAVLPNGVSAQLSGCFVVAEGIGSLQEERAHIRLVSLTCLSKKGQAVIEHDINGFVEDTDGLPGLKGRVVAKFGSVVARAAVAGFVGGLGNAMSQYGATTTIGVLGTTTALDNTSLKNIGISAAGGGISNATKEIERFYMELAHQSLPVIEVGAGKKVTLNVTKGVDLEIKSYQSVPWN